MGHARLQLTRAREVPKLGVEEATGGEKEEEEGEEEEGEEEEDANAHV